MSEQQKNTSLKKEEEPKQDKAKRLNIEALKNLKFNVNVATFFTLIIGVCSGFIWVYTKVDDVLDKVDQYEVRITQNEEVLNKVAGGNVVFFTEKGEKIQRIFEIDKSKISCEDISQSITQLTLIHHDKKCD